MLASGFSRKKHGELVKTAQGNWSFVPAPLRPELVHWSHQLVTALTAAAEAMARLQQATQEARTPYLISGISNVLATREAQLSSRIEGIYTTTTQLFLYQQNIFESETTEGHAAALAEVSNYLSALNAGIRELRGPRGLPLSLRLLRKLHGILLGGKVRGSWKQPGEFRRIQNMIGGNGDEAEAIYVPPPPDRMLVALDELERFLHTGHEQGLHVLIRSAMAHYQFEAIHPFLDGNGRMGRLLIMLMLCADDKAARPLIYPSAYIERNRQRYYELLLRVSTHGDWESWLHFFLAGIEQQSAEAMNRFKSLEQLRRAQLDRLSDERAVVQIGLGKAIDLLYETPVISAEQIAARLELSSATAYRYVKVLSDLGIIQLHSTGSRGRVYLAHEIIQVVDS